MNGHASAEREQGSATTTATATPDQVEAARTQENGHQHDDDDDHKQEQDTTRTRLPLRQWIIERMNFSWFTCTQSTGGIAILLWECPKQFSGLHTIGVIIFISNLVLWLVFTSMMTFRWTLRPDLIKKSLTSAPEGFFFGSFWLSLATMIICMQRYGLPHTGPWLIVAIRVLFWIYAAVVFLSTTIQTAEIFNQKQTKSIEMNPAWFLMVFQAMLTGTVASSIALDQPPLQRMPIIVAGVAFQGYGWISSTLILAWWFGRMMEKGWPPPSAAPGLFMIVGTAGYTIVALIGNARALPAGFEYTRTHPTANETLVIVADWVGVFMWVFAFWLFAIALYICLRSSVQRKDGRWTLPMGYNNTWWAIIFPNVGFTLATIYIGQQLGSNAILWVSTIMTIFLVAFWLMDLALMAKTIALSLFVNADKHRLL